MANRVDRRVLRTQNTLRAALVALMREKEFDAISVQDIIDRADVGRATFYAHFRNKEDLLVSGFDNLKSAMKALQQDALASRAPADERTLAFTLEMFRHVNEHRDVFRVISGKRTGAVVQQLLHKILLDLVRDDVKAITPRNQKTPIPAEAVTQFVAGGLVSVIIWWLTGKKQLSAEEVNAALRTLALSALKAGVSKT